jgi:CBS domain-containing protein
MMTAGEYCNREVVIVEKSESIREAIRLMRAHHVGDVVVVSRTNGSPDPVGILTDRDIVLEILAEDVDLDAVNIGDVMSFELTTIRSEVALLDTIKVMREQGVRRIPVVAPDGSLVGILTLDDILEVIAEQLTDIIGLIARERSEEARRMIG